MITVKKRKVVLYMTKWYVFKFEDGFETICMGYSKSEMLHETMKHGRLVSKTLLRKG